MKIDPESRRSFVKKSLATSMTITFAGLVRAHGQGSTQTTTFNPEATYVSTESPWTTFDQEATIDPTYGQSTTFDQEGTFATELITTAQPDTYKARCIDWGKMVVRRETFKIDSRELEIIIYYRVDPQRVPSHWWESYVYRTRFEAVLKEKMFGDPALGPYTGVPDNKSTGLLFASTKIRRYDAFCDPESGSINIRSQIEEAIGNKKNISSHLIYEFNGNKYKLEFTHVDDVKGDDIKLGEISGNGTSWVITRDRATAQLTKVESDADLNTAVKIVDADKVSYQPDPLPDYDYGAGKPGCYVISASQKNPE